MPATHCNTHSRKATCLIHAWDDSFVTFLSLCDSFLYEKIDWHETHCACTVLVCVWSLLDMHATAHHTAQRHPITLLHTASHWITLHHTPSHCSTLHRTVPHCTTLHHTAYCTTLHHTAPHGTTQNCTTLHHTASYCTTLHHTAPHCTTLHHTAPHRNTLHHVATRCNILLQHTATHSTCCNLFLTFWDRVIAPGPPVVIPAKVMQTYELGLPLECTYGCALYECNTLQHTATHCIWTSHFGCALYECNTLQRTATHCNTLHMNKSFRMCIIRVRRDSHRKESCLVVCCPTTVPGAYIYECALCQWVVSHIWISQVSKCVALLE